MIAPGSYPLRARCRAPPHAAPTVGDIVSQRAYSLVIYWSQRAAPLRHRRLHRRLLRALARRRPAAHRRAGAAAEVFSSAGTRCSSRATRSPSRPCGLPFSVHGPFTHAEFATTSKRQASRRARRAPPAHGGGRRAGRLALHRAPRPAPPAAALEPQGGRRAGALVRRAARPAGRSRPRGGRREHADRAPLALHGARRPRSARPGARARRGARRSYRHAGRGFRSRRRACATCTCTTTAAAATATGTPLGSGVVDFAPALGAARAAGATIALELTREADVVASLAYLSAHGLLLPPPSRSEPAPDPDDTPSDHRDRDAERLGSAAVPRDLEPFNGLRKHELEHVAHSLVETIAGRRRGGAGRRRRARHRALRGVRRHAGARQPRGGRGHHRQRRGVRPPHACSPACRRSSPRGRAPGRRSTASPATSPSTC